MTKLHLDFETRSELDLTVVGAWAYASHPSTQVLCMGVSVDRATVDVYDHNEIEHPRNVRLDFDQICAHNAQFEYAIWNLILHKRYGWAEMWEPTRWNCTMARAAQVGLPLGLGDLSKALNLKTPKDLDGRRVMQRLCRPIEYDALGDPIYDNDPQKFERLYKYNQNDVRAEMEADALLPELTPHERKIWEADLIINRRGVAIDRILTRRAAELADHLTTNLNAELWHKTNGKVDKATRIAALKTFLAANGVKVPTKFDSRANKVKETLDKVAVTDLLADPSVPTTVKEVLSIRRQVGKSSTAKYIRALKAACPDGRVRGALQYHGSHTGRWAGRLIQPQNYPKGFGAEAQAEAIDLVYDPGMFAAVYGEKGMDSLANILRGTIVAGPDHVLICCDYNAIEARGVFWLADDTAALDTYRRGESPYVDMARYIYGNDSITKKSHPQEYDIGKRTILGCGYGMGAEKFKDNIYAETAKTGKPVKIPPELAQRAVKAYREKYSSVKNMWYSVERAAISAVTNPGQKFQACGGRVLWSLSLDRRFLVCKLPSGRYLWYYQPAVRLGKTPWGEEKPELTYMGEDPVTHRWVRLKTYGGALVENITQAVARDVLANGMLTLERAGYRPILTVHDEVLGEVPNAEVVVGRKSLEEFAKLMCDLPAWATGFPIAAEGWVGERYRK